MKYKVTEEIKSCVRKRKNNEKPESNTTKIYTNTRIIDRTAKVLKICYNYLDLDVNMVLDFIADDKILSNTYKTLLYDSDSYRNKNKIYYHINGEDYEFKVYREITISKIDLELTLNNMNNK